MPNLNFVLFCFCFRSCKNKLYQHCYALHHFWDDQTFLIHVILINLKKIDVIHKLQVSHWSQLLVDIFVFLFYPFFLFPFISPQNCQSIQFRVCWDIDNSTNQRSYVSKVSQQTEFFWSTCSMNFRKVYSTQNKDLKLKKTKSGTTAKIIEIKRF